MVQSAADISGGEESLGGLSAVQKMLVSWRWSFGPAIYAIADGGCSDMENAARETMSGVGGDILISHARNEGAQLRMAC